MKACPDCGVVQGLDSFPVATKRSDGHGTYCKCCMLARSRASYRKRKAAEGKAVRDTSGLPPEHQRCPDCGLVKPLEGFPRNKNARSGRHAYCLPCHNARGKESKLRLYGGSGHYHRRYRYGLEDGEFDEMMLDQGDLCAICQEKPAEHVDHDHATGEVRGLTCFNCNGGLGQFRDRVDIMAKAIAYLERTRNPQWQKIVVSMDVFQQRSPRPEAAASPTSSELQRLISSRRG